MKTNVVDQNKVDQDYLSFMAELDGKAAPDICLPATSTAPSVPTGTAATTSTTAAEPNLESKFAAIPPPPGLNTSTATTTETNPTPTPTAALTTPIPPPVVVPPTTKCSIRNSISTTATICSIHSSISTTSLCTTTT